MGYSARRQAIAAGVLAFGLLSARPHSRRSSPRPRPTVCSIPSCRSWDGRRPSRTAPDDRPRRRPGRPDRCGSASCRRTGRLRFGNVSIGKPRAGVASLRPVLEPTSDGWQLDITGPETPGGATEPASLGKVALSRQKSAAASPTLSAALVPVGARQRTARAEVGRRHGNYRLSVPGNPAATASGRRGPADGARQSESRRRERRRASDDAVAD